MNYGVVARIDTKQKKIIWTDNSTSDIEMVPHELFKFSFEQKTVTGDGPSSRKFTGTFAQKNGIETINWDDNDVWHRNRPLAEDQIEKKIDGGLGIKFQPRWGGPGSSKDFESEIVDLSRLEGGWKRRDSDKVVGRIDAKKEKIFWTRSDPRDKNTRASWIEMISNEKIRMTRRYIKGECVMNEYIDGTVAPDFETIYWDDDIKDVWEKVKIEKKTCFKPMSSLLNGLSSVASCAGSCARRLKFELMYDENDEIPQVGQGSDSEPSSLALKPKDKIN